MPLEVAPLLQRLSHAAQGDPSRDALGAVLVREVKAGLPQASWAGIYWLEGTHLQLGPYEGPATEHVRIPVGTGVCGTAIAEDRDQLVGDVRQRANYLACSATVRSEVVVLIRAGGRVVGQLDLDSEQVDGFDADDLRVLQVAANAFGGVLGGLGRPVSRTQPTL